MNLADTPPLGHDEDVIDWQEVDREEAAARQHSIQMANKMITMEQLRRVNSWTRDNRQSREDEKSGLAASIAEANSLIVHEQLNRVRKDAESKQADRLQRKLDREHAIKMVVELAEQERARRLKLADTTRPSQPGMRSILESLKQQRREHEQQLDTQEQAEHAEQARRAQQQAEQQAQQQAAQEQAEKKAQEQAQRKAQEQEERRQHQARQQQAFLAQQRAQQVQARLQAQQKAEAEQRARMVQQQQLEAQRAWQARQQALQSQKRTKRRAPSSPDACASLVAAVQNNPLQPDPVMESLSADSRKSKNYKEKMRRDTLNGKFDELCSVLDLEPHFKRQKLAVLCEAIKSIKDLKTKLAQATQQQQHMTLTQQQFQMMPQLAPQMTPFQMAGPNTFAAGVKTSRSPRVADSPMSSSPTPPTALIRMAPVSPVSRNQTFPQSFAAQTSEAQLPDPLPTIPSLPTQTLPPIPPLSSVSSLELDIEPLELTKLQSQRSMPIEFLQENDSFFGFEDTSCSNFENVNSCLVVGEMLTAC
jgi:hypothetical protein